jgi:FkbM family methyltransferase
MEPLPRFTSMSARERWRTTRAWLRRRWRWLARMGRKRRDRFLLLHPALLARQRLFDRQGGGTHTLRIRDEVDFKVVEQIFVTLDYDFGKLARAAEIQAFHDRVRAAGRVPLIVDAGANIGMATKYFALSYPGARIVAIEPDAGNMALARSNNPDPGVQFVQAGVGSTDMRGRLVDPGSGHWGYRIEPDPGGAIEVVSIGGIVEQAEREGCVPFVAKIDIEGFEHELFARGTDWIDRFPVLIVELHDWMLPRSGSARPFLREVAARDRDFVYHGENVFSLSNTLL